MASDIVAIVVAALALVVSTYALTGTRRRTRREDADLVHLMLENYHDRIQRDPRSGRLDKSVLATARVINGSPRPIHDVGVRLLNWDWRTNPEPVASRSIHAMRPNSQSEEIDLSNLLSFPEDDTWAEPPIQLTFRTSRYRWRRDPDGRLYRWVPPRRPLRRIGDWRKD